MMKLILITGLLALCLAGEVERNMFIKFMSDHNKSYKDHHELLYRYDTFTNNLKIINQLNHKNGETAFGITAFSDLTTEEFKQQKLMNKTPNDKKHPDAPVYQPTGRAVPTSFDWRNRTGVLTPIKNQGQCGSCWAFSATETIESQWALAGKGLIHLSEQQIVDCDNTCYGCGGGWPYLAYAYIQQAHGQETESAYPYTAVNGQCADKPSEAVAKLGSPSWKYITQDKSETTMADALVAEGPLSVCVDAASWQFYTSGVIKQCGTQIDHCVQIVGYDVTSSGIPYWIVRNSWGTSWGLNGYLWVERGKDVCAIAQVVTLPIVEK